MAVFSSRSRASSLATLAQDKTAKLSKAPGPESTTTFFVEPKTEPVDQVEEPMDPIVKSENRFSCDLCPKVFNAKNTLKVHKQRKHTNSTDIGNGDVTCSFCPKLFNRKKLTQHMKNKHPNKSLVGPDVPEVDAKPWRMDVPEPAVAKQIEVAARAECKFCPKAFGGIDFLERHMKLNHSEQLPKDEDNTGDVVETLPKQEDAVTKSNEGKVVLIQCDQCQKYFGSKSSLKNHMVVHMEEKPFKCTFCGKEFTQNGNMKTHVQKHHTSDNLSMEAEIPINVAQSETATESDQVE